MNFSLTRWVYSMDAVILANAWMHKSVGALLSQLFVKNLSAPFLTCRDAGEDQAQDLGSFIAPVKGIAINSVQSLVGHPENFPQICVQLPIPG